MTTYSIYFEGYQNKVYLRENFGGHYKTLKGLQKSWNNFLNERKIICKGHVLYSFNGNEDKKYYKSSYKVLERFNCKAFFDFWDN